MPANTTTQDTAGEEDAKSRGSEWRLRALAAALAAVVVICALSGPAAAVIGATPATTDTVALVQENNSSLNETAPYYDNQTAVGNQSGWIPDDVTVESLGDIVTRFGPFIIGTGNQIPGGTTYAGTLITGMVMVGIFVGAITFANIGAPSGAVVATVAGYGLVSAGLAPSWLRVVLVMLLATVAAVAALRITQ